jgi:hypothetical protein
MAIKKSWHHGFKDSVQEDYEEGMGQAIPPEGREGRAFVHSGAEEGSYAHAVGGHMDGGRGGKHENKLISRSSGCEYPRIIVIEMFSEVVSY